MLDPMINTALALSLPTKVEPDALVWILLFSCGFASILMLVWVLNLTRRSAKEMKRDTEERLAALRTVHLEALRRVQKLDIEIVDKLRPMSVKGSEAYSMAKQIHGKIARRIAEAEKLLNTGTIDDLVKAQQLLISPIDNSGNQFESLVFSDTLLTLQPDQCAFALDMMAELIERDLDKVAQEGEAAKALAPVRVEMPSMHRVRKFTVRGFFKSLMGPT